MLLETIPGVASDAQVDRLSSRGADQGNKGVRVTAGDLPPTEDRFRLIDIHDLVAAAEDGNPRSPVDQRMRHREGGEYPQLSRPQLGAGTENLSPLADVLTGQPEIDSNVPVFDDGDCLGALVGVLLPDDAIAAFGEGSASKNSGTLAGADGSAGEMAGWDVLDDAKPN